MPIRVWWESVVSIWKKFRPARRRRASARFSVETFEPRRLLSAFVVNSLADSHDAISGDGIAADANGFTTLRAALEEANAHIGADTITLPAGVIVLSATNGPLAVTDDVTILGSSASEIDGTAFDEVFSVQNAARLQLDHVAVFSSGTLAASLRPMLLTTNARQADLIVALSTTPAAPFVVDTKTPNGLSSLIAFTTPEIVFDESPLTPAAKPATLGDFAVPTPEQAIDQIINALFRNEPDFVLPIGAEQSPRRGNEDNARPMSETDSNKDASPPKMPPNVDAESQPESMSSDAESTSDNSDDNEAVGMILRGWAHEAGWREFDFLTRGSQTVTVLPQHGSRVAVLAGALLGGVVTSSWSRVDLGSWRDSLSMTAWRTRFERLRRRAR